MNLSHEIAARISTKNQLLCNLSRYLVLVEFFFHFAVETEPKLLFRRNQMNHIIPSRLKTIEIEINRSLIVLLRTVEYAEGCGALQGPAKHRRTTDCVQIEKYEN